MNTEAKLKVALQALEDIANPVSALERELEAGCVLNGQMALSLSNDPAHLKGIANKALEIVSIKVIVKHWVQDTIEAGHWEETPPMRRQDADKMCELRVFTDARIEEVIV